MVSIAVKRFLLLETCPADWQEFNLYLFRDEAAVFYVGQSHLAFARVWEHLLSGFKGHSMMGRFIWCNWPKSMNFTIELLNAHAEEFRVAGNDLNAAEHLLIEKYAPCLNISQNRQPTPIPDGYLPPNAPFRKRRSLNALRHEAERAVRQEDHQRWLKELEDGE